MADVGEATEEEEEDQQQRGRCSEIRAVSHIERNGFMMIQMCLALAFIMLFGIEISRVWRSQICRCDTCGMMRSETNHTLELIKNFENTNDVRFALNCNCNSFVSPTDRLWPGRGEALACANP